MGHLLYQQLSRCDVEGLLGEGAPFAVSSSRPGDLCRRPSLRQKAQFVQKPGDRISVEVRSKAIGAGEQGVADELGAANRSQKTGSCV